MKKNIFIGCGTALVTPFTEDGVDFVTLKKLIDFQIQQGHFLHGKCRKADGNIGGGCRRRGKKSCRPQHLRQLQDVEHFAQ